LTIKAEPQPAFLGVERSLGGKRWRARLVDDRAGLALAQTSGLPEIAARALAARGIDADTLDANMGLVAFYRNIQIHTHKLIRECGHATLRKYVSFIPHWLQMKQPFIKMMTTDTGRRLAQERQQRNEAAYRHLMPEIDDIKRFRGEGLMGVIEFFMMCNGNPDLQRDLRDLQTKWLTDGPKQPYVQTFCRDLEDEIAGRK